MTIVHEIKNLEGCGCSGGSAALSDCGAGVLSIKCCTNKASNSVESIDIPKATIPIKMQSDLTNEILQTNYKQVNIEFENVKYTVRKFSMDEKKFSK